MYVLGVAAYQYDASAALLCGGNIVTSAEEAKFGKPRNLSCFPAHAIEECLSSADVSLRDIDIIAFNHDPLKVFCFDFKKIASEPNMFWPILSRAHYFLSFYQKLHRDFKTCFPCDDRCFNKKVRYIEHHLCHAAAAYFPSPFDSAAILTADGCGESTTIQYGLAVGEQIKKIKVIRYPASLGKFYSAVTAHLGFAPCAEEAVVMQLSSEGDRSLVGMFRNIASTNSEGDFRLDMDYFDFYDSKKRRCSDKFRRVFGQQRMAGESINLRHRNIASALQETLEENVLTMLKYLRRETKIENLCLGGGIFLNQYLNAAVTDSGIFKRVYIAALPGDTGTSAGAAYYSYYKLAR